MITIMIIGSITAVVALVLIVAYISVLIDDKEYYKMRAERYEEIYFEELNQKTEWNEQMCKKHQDMHEKGVPFKGFYGKTV